MEELCEEFCLYFEDGPIDLKKVAIQVAHLSKILSNATSKFVDIAAGAYEGLGNISTLADLTKHKAK